MAKIILNGEQTETTLPVNVRQLLTANNVSQPDMVSVQVNGEFAEREGWENIIIKEGDEVDFLYFMGGGAA